MRRVGARVVRYAACLSAALLLLMDGHVAHAQAAVSTIGDAARFPYAPGVDVQRYDVYVTLPLRGHEIRARALLTVDRANSVSALSLDLIALTVDRVSVNGRSREFGRDSATIRIPLTVKDGTRIHVRVDYHGEPRDGLIIREDPDRGWSAFGDNWPNRARYWIPSIDHPSDKALVNWTVTAPASLSIVANGARITRVLLPSTRDVATRFARTSFRMTKPIPTYLMVIGAARMQESSLGRTACGSAVGGGCILQSVWTFLPEVKTMPGHFREAGAIVSTFAKLVGPYAYDRLTHVQSATRFGGMENATAIFYSDDAFRKGGVGVSLIAHETAHQWFGDAVTPRRWPDLWLSEGFATYFAALYTERSRGDSAFKDEMRRIRETVIAAPIVAGRPVVDSVGGETPLSLLNRNSYEKGAFVLHMLRGSMGSDVFFRALRDYQNRYRNGTATTDDLRAALEQRAGTSYEGFFDQWLHRPGFADLTITWTWNASTKSLMLQIVQGTTFAPYSGPLTVAIRTGATTRLITVPFAAKQSQLIVIPLPDARDIDDVIADPNVALLARISMLHAIE